jgi:uncharacterized protein YidB (DUF937 family)
MSKSTPSLLALLGLVAVAGYQNRGRISEMLSDAQEAGQRRTSGSEGQDGFLGELSQTFQASSVGSSIAGALAEITARFKENGQSETADSWVSKRQNRPLSADDLDLTLGTENLDLLAQKTGLSRDEIKRRLATALPELVDRLTPDGRLPTEEEVQRLV